MRWRLHPAPFDLRSPRRITARWARAKPTLGEAHGGEPRPRAAAEGEAHPDRGIDNYLLFERLCFFLYCGIFRRRQGGWVGAAAGVRLTTTTTRA